MFSNVFCGPLGGSGRFLGASRGAQHCSSATSAARYPALSQAALVTLIAIGVARATDAPAFAIPSAWVVACPQARPCRANILRSLTQDPLPCRVNIRLEGARSSWEMIPNGLGTSPGNYCEFLHFVMNFSE